MRINYNRLWKLLIDKGLNKTKLTTIAGITTNAVAKMGKNESVQLEVLAKICDALNCTMDDIVEFIPEENDNSSESRKMDLQSNTIQKT